jgi:chaperone required for assembly of F1-ATPase
MPDEARDPMRAAQANMRAAPIKRFFKQVGVGEPEGGGFALLLDGKRTRTPGKRPLVLPTRVVAELIASEWAGQGETIEPAAMPATRLANSAIDGVADAIEETRAEIARYAGADLVCYRASAPVALAQSQAAAFDPVAAWAEATLGARFALSASLTHVAQPQAALDAARAAVDAFADPFALAGLHVMTSLTGSALLALMVARGALAPEAAWRSAHVDEDFQIANWGADEEARARREARWRDFEAASRFVAARV